MQVRHVAAGVALLLGPLGSAHAYDLVQLFETHYAGEVAPGVPESDTFLTTDLRQSDDSVDLDGAVRRGVVGWLPCSPPALTGPGGEPPLPGTANPDMGFPMPMAFACAQPAASAPFYRLYKGWPQTEHLYTADAVEAGAAIASGYVFERVEGYIFTSPPPGATALHRLSNCVPGADGCNRERRYTIDANAKDALLAAGWTDDGVAGYVYDGYVNDTVQAQYDGTYNGIAVTSAAPTTIPIQNVAPPKSRLEIKGIERGPLYGYVQSNTTPRPANAAKMRAKFSLFTGDLFDAQTNVSHIPIVLYGHAQAASDGISAGPVDGIGIFFARANAWHAAIAGCRPDIFSGGQIWVELYGNRARIECETNLELPLLPYTWYDVVLTVDDAAVLDLEVRFSLFVGAGPPLPFKTGQAHPPVSYASRYPCPLDPETAPLTPSTAHCANPYAHERVPNHRTGYFVIPVMLASSTPSDGGAIRGFTIQWLDANGNVLSSL
ncbi:MAG TPA: hypothetical protein VJ724_04765 [Tahibacter sp.]|nr:hypothetical protein [Tahibacter sp.]